MSHATFSRRRILAAIAAAGGASRLGPFLPASVRAAGTPKRILTVFHPMGYLESSFWPTGSGADFTLGETQTALNPWKSKLLYLHGLALYGAPYYFNNDDNEHASGGNMVFTGAKKQGHATGPSIEQAIADFQYPQAKTKFRALALGVNAGGTSPHSTVFHSKAQTPVAAQNNVQATFDMLFSGFTGPTAPPPSGGTAMPTPTPPAPIGTAAADLARKQQQSVLNLVKADLNRIRGLAGRDDQQKIEAHMDGISSLENRLGMTATTTPSMATPSAMTATPPVAPGTAGSGCAKPTLASDSAVQAQARAQMDIITAALACDMTRHASLQFGQCDGGLPDSIADGANQHDTTHKCGDTKGAAPHPQNHVKYDRWFAAQWAYLLGKLDSVKEGNGTLLDNTLVVFGSDTTTPTGADWYGPHAHFRFPLWMAGGGAFAFKTGQFIKLPQPAKAPQSKTDLAQWVVHQRLLTSIAQAFGMNVDTFGDNDPGKGPVTQLTRV